MSRFVPRGGHARFGGECWRFLALAACWAVAAPCVSSAREAARVEGQPVDDSEVAQSLREAFRTRKISPEALPRLQAQALEQIIDRRLVAGYLQRNRAGVTDQEVTDAVEQFAKRLETTGKSLADYLQHEGLSEADLRRRASWQMSWKRYTARVLDDAALEAYFQRFHRHLDGTQVQVSHLLLRPDGEPTAEKIAALLAQAESLKAQVASGALSFAQAVERHSQGTKKGAGDLGFIRRHGSMPEAFAQAAFSLERGQVSKPVVTQFGVHLIYCADIKPGTKTIKDVRRELETLAKREEFKKIADRERRGAKIEFTGALPYFKPGTNEIVAP